MRILAPLLWMIFEGCLSGTDTKPTAISEKRSETEDSGDTFTTASTGLLRFPLDDSDHFKMDFQINIDHDGFDDPNDIDCIDYMGRMLPWCYDEHNGTDYILDGGFDAMDAAQGQIVAAADGVVIEVEEDNYDRCHVEGLEVDCDGYPKKANYITIEHQDREGNYYTTSYLHMAQYSVAVYVGDEVSCGDFLGWVGSSGNSSFPHLHFMVNDDDGNLVDPYAGDYSQAESLWVEQGDSEGFPSQECAAG